MYLGLGRPFFFNEVLFLLIKKKLMIWKILLVPRHETEEVGYEPKFFMLLVMLVEECAV